MTTGTTAGSPQVGSIAARAFVAGGLLTLLTARDLSPNVPLAGVVVLAALVLDRRHPLTLKNFFLAYSLLVFGVGGAVLDLAPDSVMADLFWYLVAFLAGYAVASLRMSHGTPAVAEAGPRVDVATAARAKVPPAAVEAAMLVIVGLYLAFLAIQLFRYGIVGYYRGQPLFEQFLTYGQASVGGGAEQIVRFLLRFGAVGLTVLYTQACFETPARIRYRYPLALLVLFPILTLRRYDAVVGAVTALAIYGCERRVAARQRQVGDEGAERPTVPSRPASRLMRATALGAAAVSAVFAAFTIGLLRQGFHVASTGGATADSGSLPILTSELSPVQAYGDIRANIGVLGHPRGRTIVLPLALKMVPRAWLPDKPLNSGAYYMSTVRPAEFEAGFALPPTFFGDAYLSFGLGGAMAACLLLGIAAARLDLAYKQTILPRLPLYLLIWANFFSIMRDPMSESLAGVLLTLAVWLLARRLLRTKVVSPDAEPAGGVPASPAPARISQRLRPEGLA